MLSSDARYRLELMGAFRLYAPDGRRIEVASRKGMALMAMLAMAKGGERTRSWLQDRLWGSRQRAQAQQSLRRELGNLRQLIPANDLIAADYDRVRLDLSSCSVDALEILSGAMPQLQAMRAGEFLEGFDLAGEDGFEDWLREQRRQIGEALAGRPPEAAAPPAAAPGTRSGKPSIAMLPIAGLDGGPASDAVRLVEVELVDRISRIRWLSLIARQAAEPRRGDGSGAMSGAALDADYLLEVKPLGDGDPGRIAVTLVETSGRHTLLLRHLSLAVDRNELGEQCRFLVSAIDAQMETAEQQRVLHKPLDRLRGGERIWRARWHLDRLNRADATVARRLLDAVMAEQPDLPEALIQLGFCKAWSIWAGRGSHEDIADLRRTALRAVAADPYDARGHLLVGMAETWLRRPDRACLALQEAIRLNPGLGQAYMQLGSARYLGGDPQAALAPMDTALALNPQNTQLFCVQAERGMVGCMLGDHDEAIRMAELALLRRPAYWFAHLVKIAALFQLDRLADAQAAYGDLRRAKPNFSADFIEWLPFTTSEWPEFLRSALTAAGGAGGSGR